MRVLSGNGKSCERAAGAQSAGFTILEMLVASAVFMLLMGILLTTVAQTGSVTQRAGDKISAFQGARAAFDLLTATLSQATLNTYWDFYDSSGKSASDPAYNGIPKRYGRQSELHFLVGNAGVAPFPGTVNTGQAVFFQAALGQSAAVESRGLQELLNVCGYYIQYADVKSLPSTFPGTSTAGYRYQLMQEIEPSEDLSVYATAAGNAWVKSSSPVPVAENVIYLAIWPRRSPLDDAAGDALTSDYSYDSRDDADADPQPPTAHQMPPVVQVTMVVMDEASASHLCTGSSPPQKVTDAFSGLFGTSETAQHEEDLKVMEARLGAAGINHRAFTAMIPIRESRME